MFRNRIRFYGEENPKLEDYPLSAVRDCIFSIFAATLHIGGLSSILNMRTRHAVVTGTHLSRSNFKISTQKGKGKGKGKAVPLQAWSDFEGSRRVKLPDYNTVGT